MPTLFYLPSLRCPSDRFHRHILRTNLNWWLTVLLPLLAVCLAVPATAQKWTQQNPSTSPPPRVDAAMVFDAAHGYVLLFGGLTPNGYSLNDTWTWDGITWTQRFPATSPPARVYHSMVYDASHQDIVLFGGNKYDSLVTFLGDTWTWDGTNWTQHVTSTAPAARDDADMAYDASHGNVVLFGGEGPNPTDYSDTWVWDGTVWTQKSSAGEPVIYGNAAAYDSSSGNVVLVDQNSKTWTWDGTTLTLKSPVTGLPVVGHVGLTYDADRGDVMLFGGYQRPTYAGSQETWNWDGTTWTQLFPATSPLPRDFCALAYDPIRGNDVLFGGRGDFGGLADTWTYGSPTPFLTSPTASILSGLTQFTWDRGEEAPNQFELTVGTGGAGTNDIYDSGKVAGTVTSESATIPPDGKPLYVRLSWQVAGTWSDTDYTFTEEGPPSLTSPAASPISGSTQFTWNPGVGSARFLLQVGTAFPGSSDLYNGPEVPNTVTSETVNIPSDGVTLFVRLYYLMNGSWNHVDYTFTEAGTPKPPSLTSPSASPISGSTNFTWTPGAGPVRFLLRVGTAGAGSSDLYNGPEVANTLTSQTVAIPSDGVNVYVRLYYLMNRTWNDLDYIFTEAGTPKPPSLTSPAASPISGSTQFTWNPGVGSARFLLLAGTGCPGCSDLYNGPEVANTVTSQTVAIPSNGVNVYVRLWYNMNGSWNHLDYTFTEAGTPKPPSLTSPAASPISGSTQFIWNPGVGSARFILRVGTAGYGSSNLWNSGEVANAVTSQTVSIPAGGKTVHVRLYYEMNATWSYKDYTFTEAP